MTLFSTFFALLLAFAGVFWHISLTLHGEDNAPIIGRSHNKEDLLMSTLMWLVYSRPHAQLLLSHMCIYVLARSRIMNCFAILLHY